jgi:hypothetical protein
MPEAFQIQFLEPINFGDAIVLTGTIDEVWHQPRWLALPLWLSTLTNVLFPETGRNIPARLVVSPARTRDGRSVQLWRRTFRFPRARRFNATLAYDPVSDSLIEALGPGGVLETDWSARYVPPARLVIESRNAWIRLGFLRIPLPASLTPRVRVIQDAAASPDSVRVDFLMRHPFLGDIFGYSGTFRRSRRIRS